MLVALSVGVSPLFILVVADGMQKPFPASCEILILELRNNCITINLTALAASQLILGLTLIVCFHRNEGITSCCKIQWLHGK